jgi:DNA-binding NarL/FixJ family response regulator
VKKLRLLLVDDQAMFREGLRLILRQQTDFEIVGEVGDGLAAIESVRRTAPDVVLMDLRMPGLGGVEATRRIKAEAPAVKVIVLTTFEEDAEVFSALRAGAAGFLLKDAPSEKLCEAKFGRLSPRPPLSQTSRLIEPLSAREQDVLRCLADGMSNKEIGRRLAISEGTVKNHMSQVLGKLQVLDRTQAALRARELGLL